MGPVPWFPKKIELESQETPVLVTRKHWYVFRDPVLLALFVPFVLLSAVFFFDYSSLPIWLKDNLGQLSLILAGVSFAIGLLFSLWRYFLWSRTFYILTNKRLILVIQRGLFSCEERQASLNMIQDVKGEIKGLQASLYGFGDVIVQTASTADPMLRLNMVGRPRKVQKIIMQQSHLR
ncbi:MAG: PH domain-containing protein [Candidatus Cloacimonetes bacterium]|nr:PH domain-containing protein [Candidatus Cloacimonadota bacterium]